MTIKDAPVELSDTAIVNVLSNYGQVVQNSIRYGKIKETNILNGTRYLALTQVKDVVPTDHTIDEFTIRIYCDNGKTRCKYCEMTDHPYFRCPGRSADKVVKTGRCFKCHDKGHTINECSNP